MSSSRLLFLEKISLTPMRQSSTSKLMSRTIRHQGLTTTHSLYTPFASCNNVQIRSYVNLPSKQQVERFTYKSIAQTIDFIKKVRSSECYHDLKQWMLNSYVWSIELFKKNVVENPKVKSYSNDFKRKIDAAREERSKRE